MSAPVKRWLACALGTTIAAFALVFLSTAACGGTKSNEAEAGTDSGTGDQRAPRKDAPLGDAPIRDARPASDSPIPDCAIPTEGGPTIPDGAIQLVHTADAGLSGITVLGLTEDDFFVVYYGYTSCATPETVETTGLYATSLAGRLTEGRASGFGPASISHSTIFGWGEVDASVGPLLGVATELYGITQAHIGSTAVGLVAASPDSTKIAHTANVSPNGDSGDLYGGRSDFATAMKLLDATVPNQMVGLAFVDNRYLLAVHQELTDSGTTPLELTSWDTTASPWARQDLVPSVLVPASAFPWGAATAGPDAGTTIVAVTVANELVAIPVAGLDGGAAPIIGVGVDSFYVKPDGSAVLYSTLAGGYNVAALPSGSPTTDILPGDGGYVRFVDGPPIALSPDGNWSIFYTAKGKLPSAYSLDLVQNDAAATPTPLVSTATGGIFQDAFTADSTYALYYTGLAAEGSMRSVGQLNARPVAGGSAVTVSGDGGWQSNYLTGTKIVYADNARIGPGGRPVADISIVDVSVTPLAPLSIVKSADANYFLTTDRTALVFGLNTGNTTTDGIYLYRP